MQFELATAVERLSLCEQVGNIVRTERLGTQTIPDPSLRRSSRDRYD